MVKKTQPFERRYRLDTKRVGNLPRYISIIEGITTQWNLPNGHVWFRGVNNHSLDLVPQVVWRNVDDENSLIEDFLVSYAPIHGSTIADSWELYGLLQHHGLPTRLLDWTKSPLMALYFALEDSLDVSKARTDRAVWVLNPYRLNRISSGEEALYVARTSAGGNSGTSVTINSYLPTALRDDSEGIPEMPIAIEPPLSNKRMLSQQGCFTVHGSAKKPIDAVLADNRGNGAIVKVTIPASANAEQMLLELFSLGIREDAVYQDLSSLAARIVRERL